MFVHLAHSCVCFCKADAQVLGPPVQSCVGFVGRMPRFLVGRPIFYKQVCHGASVLDILGHPWASVFRNVGFEGHPFSQKGHPLTRNVGFGGHQARPVALFKIKKRGPPGGAIRQSHPQPQPSRGEEAVLEFYRALRPCRRACEQPYWWAAGLPGTRATLLVSGRAARHAGRLAGGEGAGCRTGQRADWPAGGAA